MLSLLLLIPVLGSITLLFVEDTPSGDKSKKIALATSMINLVLSIYLWIQFDSSTSQYQFVYNFKELSFCHLNIGVDGLSIYFVLLTTFITPIALLSNYNNIKINLKYFLISFLLLETLQIALFVVLDLLLFYVFFESVLPVLFVVIILYGSGEAKVRSALLFFLYTLAGSLFMLLAILEISNYVGSTDFQLISLSEINLESQKFLWLAFFLAFAIKTPLWPMTGWLYRAHADSPLAGSIILAAILLKLSTYGILRVLLNFLPDATLYFTPLVQTIAIITLIFASLATIVQQDTKALIAYSSIAHMAVVTLGLFSNTVQGLEGAILLAIAHGFVSPALFICVGGVIYDRTGVRLIPYIRGLVLYMPVFTILFFIFTLCNTAVPLSLNWVGEQLCLIGIWEVSPIVSVLGATGIVFSAIYSIWLYNRLSYGSSSPYLKPLRDITRREFLLLLSLLIPTILLGVSPNVVLDTLHASVTTLLYNIPSNICLDSSIAVVSLIGIRQNKLKLNSVNLIRSFHCCSVLNVLEDPNGSKGKSTIVNQETENTDMSLEEVDELLNNSNNISSFAEAFPNYSEFLQGRQINNTIQENFVTLTRERTAEEIVANSPVLSELLAPVIQNPRSYANTNLFGLDPVLSLLNVSNIESGNFNAYLSRVYETISNPETVIGEAGPSQVRPFSITNFISYENNRIVIDLDSTQDFFDRSLAFARRYSDQIDGAIDGFIVPGLSSYFIYKNVVKLFAKTAYSDISHLPPNSQVDLLKHRTRTTAAFNGFGAVLVTFSLAVISSLVTNNLRHKNSINVKFFLGENKDKENASLIFLTLLKKIKGPNWLKYLILIIITIILFIFLRNNLLFVINYFTSIDFFWFKLIPTIIGCVLILFHLLSVIILLKFSFVPDDGIIIPQFIPNRIRNYLLELKKFSKGEATNHYIYIHIVGVLFIIISLIIFLITMNILPLIWVKL